MRLHVWNLFRVVVCLAVMSFACSCESSSGGDATEESAPASGGDTAVAPTLTGNWSGKLKGTSTVAMNMTLIQTGKSITGSYQDDAGENGTVNGSISGDAVSLTVKITTPVAATLTFNATANTDRTALTGGTFSGGGLSGTWSATKD